MSLRLASLCLIVCTAVALGVRLHRGPTDGGMVEEDAHFHLRRAEEILRQGPGILLQTDSMISWPQGMRMALPPGYPLLLSGLAWWARPQPVDRVAAESVAYLGAAAVPIAYALARAAALPAPLALVSAGAVALLPAHVELTRAGRVDHHVLEPSLLWAALALLLSAAARRSLWRAAGAGLVLGGLFFFSPTALLGAALYCACAGWLAQRRAREPAVSLLVGAGLTGLVCLGWGAPGYSADELSALQPLLLLGVAAALAAGGVVAPGARRLPALLAGGGVLVLGLLLSGAVSGVFSFAARRGLAGTMVETRGLFAFGLYPALAPLGGLVGLVPVAALGLLYRLRRRTGPAGDLTEVDLQATLGLLALLTWVIVLQQRRFMHLAALPAAAVLVAGGAGLWRRLAGRPLAARRGLVVAAACAAWAPVVRYYLEPPTGMSVRHHAVRRLCELLRQQPPGPVLSQWPYGHILARFGGHPVMASPFLTPQTEPNALAATALLLDEDPARAVAEMARRGLRYVVATPPVPGVTARYLQALGDPRPPARVEARSLMSRLIYEHGAGIAGLRELGSIPDPVGGPAPQAVLFERVDLGGAPGGAR